MTTRATAATEGDFEKRKKQGFKMHVLIALFPFKISKKMLIDDLKQRQELLYEFLGGFSQEELREVVDFFEKNNEFLDREIENQSQK